MIRQAVYSLPAVTLTVQLFCDHWEPEILKLVVIELVPWRAERNTFMNTNITAQMFHRLLGNFRDDYRNQEEISKPIMEAMDPLFREVSDLKPSEKNDEYKSIWIMLPRGDISEFGSFEDFKEDGEVDTYEEFEELWKSYYPDDPMWYEVKLIENSPKSNSKFRFLIVDKYYVIAADLNRPFREEAWFRDEPTIELCKLLLEPVKKSMEMVRNGTYNDCVEENLPFQHRTGVIRRKDLWIVCPENKESIFEGLDEDTYKEFQEFLSTNSEDDISRIQNFTANDFFEACAAGYRACGYDMIDAKTGKEMSPVDLYLRYADGRDEGLTGQGDGLHSDTGGIDFSDPDAWDQWFFDRERHGGHPWEVCRGGNSTHVDLFVRNDKNHLYYLFRLGEIDEEEYHNRLEAAGYYFEVAGNAWTRSVEAIHFFVAIRKLGCPVILHGAAAINARFHGEDFIGIVPASVTPRYCESMFPESYGTILDFMHVYEDEIEKLKDYIEWLPEPPASLSGSIQ